MPSYAPVTSPKKTGYVVTLANISVFGLSFRSEID